MPWLRILFAIERPFVRQPKAENARAALRILFVLSRVNMFRDIDIVATMKPEVCQSLGYSKKLNNLKPARV